VNGEAFSADIIMKQVFSHTPALAERSSAPGTNPYRVIEPIRALRKELGLTPNDLVTLQALISFMPKKAGQTAPMTIVFPSNASLSERTNGLNERTIRRCVLRHGYETALCAGYAAILTTVAASASRAFCSSLI
jgi:replication initiation protein RepC